LATAQGNFSFRLLDDLGTKVPDPVYFTVDDSNTLADIIADAAAMATLLDAVTGSQIVEITLNISGIAVPGGAKASPIAGSRNNQIGAFPMRVAGTSKEYTPTVPALRDTLIVNEEINNAAAAITALTGELVTPTGTVDWSSADFRDMIDWFASYISFRKHRKQNIGKSYQTV
jgi:hypothetical protein